MAFLAALVGCGWQTGLLLPDGAETVGVEIFGIDKDVLERDVEPQLHDQITRSVSDLVSAQLVRPSDADVVIQGQILDYRRRSGITSIQGGLLETGVLIAIEAQLLRRSSGQVLGQTVVSVPRGYVTAERDQGAFLAGSAEAEAEARTRVLRFLADQIVLDLFGSPQEPQEAEVP